jgi:predicted GNAT superfamily acetyltransferase
MRGIARHDEHIAGQPRASHPREAVISVPATIRKLKDIASQEAADVQARVRTEFQAWFNRGYAVTGFVMGNDSGKYLLEAGDGCVKSVATSLGWLRETETLFAEERPRGGSWGVRI